MSGRAFWTLLSVLMGIALGVRGYTLTSRPLWYDELFTQAVVTSSANLSDVWSSAEGDQAEHPPLFYLVEWVVAHNNTTPLTLRVVSFVVGVLGVLTLGLLFRGAIGQRASLGAAALLAFCVYHIEFSQDARSYALLFLLAIITHGGFLHYHRTRSMGAIVVAFIALLAGLYTHHLGTLTAVSATSWIIAVEVYDVLQRQERTFRSVLISLAPLAVGFFVCGGLYLPQLFRMLRYSKVSFGEDVHVLQLTSRMAVELVGRWGNGAEWSIFYLCCAAIGVAALSRKNWKTSLLLGLWLVIPFLFFGFRPFTKFFDSRYVFCSLAPFWLFTAYGLDSALNQISNALVRAGLVSLPGAARDVAITVGSLSVFGLISYATIVTFQHTTERCGNFFYAPELLARDNGFCERILVLNSLHAEHRFLLQSVTR